MRSLPRRKLKKEYYITISLSEMEIFFERISNHKHRLVFQLMGLAGLRVSEITGNEVEMDRRNFIIQNKLKSLSDEEKEPFIKRKNGKERKIILNKLPGIKIKDIDLIRHSIRIMGKGFKPRIVPMTDKLAKALKNYMIHYCRDKHPDDKLINISRITLYNLTRKYGKYILNEPNLHPHAFRHSFGSNLYELGYDSLSIAEIMGHSNTKMVDEVYIHLSNQRKKQIVSSMDKKTKWQKWQDKRRQKRLRAYGEITVNQEKIFIGRKDELRKLEFLKDGQSAVFFGEKGVGKTAIINELVRKTPEKYYLVKSRPKKEILINLILQNEGITDEDGAELRRKQLNKEYPSFTALITNFPKLKRRVIFDEIKLSEGERNNLKALRERIDIIYVTSDEKEADLLDIQIIVKELSEEDKNLIVGQMVHVISRDENNKMILVEKVLRYANMDLKKSEFIIEQMANGMDIDDLKIDGYDEDADTISFGPIIFISVIGIGYYIIAGALGTGFAAGFVAVVLYRLFVTYFRPKSTMGRVAD